MGQSGCRRSIDVLASGFSATEWSESIRQIGNCSKYHQRLVTETRDYLKVVRMLRETALEEEETARRMEEQKNKAPIAAPRRPLPTGTRLHRSNR